MTLFIGGKELDIPRNELRLARKAVDGFVDVVQKSAKDKPALYLVTLLMMYKKSTELLNEFGIENIQYVMERFGSEATHLGDDEPVQ